MSVTDTTLQVISNVSSTLAVAEEQDDMETLAAVIAACRVLEARAMAALASRVSQGDILVAEQGALTALGW